MSTFSIYILGAILAIGAFIIGFKIKELSSIASDEQLNKVKEWLLYAVAIAEQELGGGTGQLKLRQVYGEFITKFPAIAAVITFAQFSGLVDEVLVQFRNIIQSNKAVQELVQQ